MNGSNNLTPEVITSYEIGYQGWFLKHRLRARLDLFFNHISDLIGRGGVTGSTTAFTFFNGATATSNGGSADIYGFETGVEFLATPWLTGFANYAFQEIGQTYSTTNRVHRGAPRVKANVGFRAELDNGLNGEITLHYVGSANYSIDPSFAAFSIPPFLGSPPPSSKVESYVLLNLRSAYQFWKVGGRNQAEVALAIFNTLNDRHKEHPLGETLGSRVMGWFTVKFDSFKVPGQ